MTNHADRLAKLSHRGLWIALSLILVLGAYAVIINAFPDSQAAAMADRLAMLLPLAIIIALGAMQSSLKGLSIDPRSKPMQAVLNDELRQHSLNRAYRNALVAVLLAQPVLALLVTVAALRHPAVLMASLTGLAGVATLLGSLLAYDR